MKKREKQEIIDTIECEGFDYAFRFYSTFDGVKDSKFHKLRVAYVQAANALSEFLGVED